MTSETHKELGVVGSWWQGMMKHAATNKVADPNYFATRPELLQTEAQVGAFLVGNGNDIYSHICPAIEQAQEEVVLITCFWARSTSLDMLRNSLQALSDRVIKEKRDKIRVSIGFSSLSALQKLFHTKSLRGKIYPGDEWNEKLWLPGPADLPGLDLQIKSIFVLPFSVMHPKFVIIDRKVVYLPSCNVSWESWFEGCITLSGPIVKQFITFWQTFWLRSGAWHSILDDSTNTIEDDKAILSERSTEFPPGAAYRKVDLHERPPCYAIFLPSPHHRNPQFSFPWQNARPPPPTPLNSFITELLESATASVYMQTPNVTSPPVLRSILQALKRGINIHIVTSEKLMILEQLVTAGTTTSRCIRKLVKLYKRSRASSHISDEEQGVVQIGQLKVEYYEPIPESERFEGEPVQSHLKLSIVDEEWTVLGSGNMDRASWYTSQELGVAFRSHELATDVRQVVANQMLGRTKTAFDSTTS